MFINEYFKTPIWSEEKPEFVKSLNKASDKYIKEARKRDKKNIRINKDFGTTHHSTPLTKDNDFIDLRNLYRSKVLGIFRSSWLRYETISNFVF